MSSKRIIFIKKIYAFFAYHNIGRFRRLPRIFAIILRKFSRQKATSYDLPIYTYDGSNQAVHPDILFDEKSDNYVICFTPYPFGIDGYENPCVQFGSDMYNMHIAKPTPLKLSDINTNKCHLCDPVLCGYDKNFYCIYLDILNFQGIRKCLFYYSTSSDIKNWSSPKFIKGFEYLQSTKLHSLCPAVVIYADIFYFFIVQVDVEKESFLILSKGKNLEECKNEQKCIVHNIPDGYYIWHIGISFYKDFKKNHLMQDDKKLIGIFLLRKNGAKAEYKTVFAYSDNFTEWYITSELDVPKEFEENAAAIYKGAMIPKENAVIISYRDYEHRWKIAKIPYKTKTLI